MTFSPSFAFAGSCFLPLGFEDKRLTDGQFTASSYYNSNYSPWYGRLNSYNSWGPRTNNVNQWLQVNFVAIFKVTGIATQGRHNANYWVKKYIVSYSTDSTNFRYYTEGRGAKVGEMLELCLSVRRNMSYAI